MIGSNDEKLKLLQPRPGKIFLYKVLVEGRGTIVAGSYVVTVVLVVNLNWRRPGRGIRLLRKRSIRQHLEPC